MATLMQKFGIDQLTRAEQTELLEAIQEHLDETEEFVMTDELGVELERIGAALDAGTMTSSPWEEVRQRLLEEFSQ